MSRRADYVFDRVACPTGCGGGLTHHTDMCGRCGYSAWEEEKKRMAARHAELTASCYDHEFRELATS